MIMLAALPPWLLQAVASDRVERFRNLLADITTLKLVQAVLIVAIAFAALFTTDRAINWLSEQVPRQYRLSIKHSLPFWRALIFSVSLALLVGLFLNLSPNNVLAVTGTAAVALGFAFKDYVSSITAGILALFERPYQVGDRIHIGDVYGEVTAYGLRSIQLKTPSDDTVTLPHNLIWNQPVINTNKGDLEAQVVTHFYLDHQVDGPQVIPLLYRVAYTSKYTQLQMPVEVVLEDQPWGTHLQLKAYPMDVRDEFVYQSDLTQRAKHQFARLGLSYPHLPAWGQGQP